MKDLTSANAFPDQVKRLKRIVKNRKKNIEEYDDFLVSLKEQKREAENANQLEDLSLNGYTDRFSQEQFNSASQLQKDNFDDSIERLKKDFEPNEVNSDVQNSQLAINQEENTMQSNLLTRITLNLRDNLADYFEEQENYYQDKSELEQRLSQKTRLLSKWNSALYSARIFGATALGAVVNLLVAIPRFKIFPFELLCGSLIMYLNENKKLMKFNDGVFRGNVSLNNKKIAPLAKKNRKELYSATKQTKEENDMQIEQNNDSSSYDNFGNDSFNDEFGSSSFNDDNNFDDNDIFSDNNSDLDLGGLSGIGNNSDSNYSSIADAFNDNEEDNFSKSNNEVKHKTHLIAEPVSKSNTPNSDFIKSLNLDCDTITPENMAESEIKFKDGKFETHIFHEQAKKIYQEFYQNRKELGKKAKTRKDIFRIFSPIISKFNKDFGEFKPVPFDSNVVKNLTYILFLTFSEISPSFRKISKNEFNPDYYIFIGNCTETALYYKFDFKLPSLISLDVFKNKLSVVERYLKKSSNDNAVEISLEQKEDGGSLKIFKVKYIEEKGNLLPAISTGDVLRFKGMKYNNQEIADNLAGTGDYRCFLGMREGEYPAIQDFGATQNTALSVIGGSGAGKTLTLVSMLLNTLLIYPPEEVGFIIMDAKSGKEWRQFKLLPHVLGYFGAKDFKDYADILEIVKAIKEVRNDFLSNKVKTDKSNYAEARIKYSKNANWDKIKMIPRLIVICDEQFALLKSLNTLDNQNKEYNRNKEKDEPKLSVSNERHYRNILADIAVTVREAGITVVGISQRSTNDAIPRDFMLGGSSMHLWLRCNDESDFLNFNSNSHYKVGNLPTGTGYFFANGSFQKGIKVNSTLTCGSPEASNEFMLLMCFLWNILQANRGYDMFDETETFGFKQLKNIKQLKNTKQLKNIPDINVVNRPTSTVEAVKKLYQGNIFAEDIGEEKMKIDIVDDVLANISEESKKRFPKDYCDLVEIKYPEKAKVLRQELSVHSTTAQEAIEREQKEQEEPKQNKYQEEFQKNLQQETPSNSRQDDNILVGEVIPDNAFISDTQLTRDGVYSNSEEQDDEELLKGEKESIQKIKDEVEKNQQTEQENQDNTESEEENNSSDETLNEEPDAEDLFNMFGKNNEDIQEDFEQSNSENIENTKDEKVKKEVPSVVEKHVGKEVPKDKQIIDDGTRDRPQNAQSIRKYCLAHHLETVSLSELRKYFSENAINTAVNNAILLSSLSDDELIFAGK